LRLLLDTHALLWWLFDLDRLGKSARAALEDGENEIMVSAVSAMEVTTKFRLGKLPDAERLATNFHSEIQTEKFAELPISVEHSALAGSMPINHKDPFDRLLIAQARLEDLPILSNETVFDGFGVARIW
jgi:PIN domain nuclease of toxin-antitoxin system